MMSVARYTRFVMIGRNFLWMLIACVLALVAWIASDDGGDSGKRLVFTNVPHMASGENVMEKPHYQGLDAHNRPYTIIADQATQVDADNVSLDMLRADMLQSNGKWVALNSEAGNYNTRTKQIYLSGGVNLFYEGGYEMKTDHAQADIHTGTAWGDAFVESQGPTGTLEADSFHVFERGKVIRFDGSVKMRVYP